MAEHERQSEALPTAPRGQRDLDRAVGRHGRRRQPLAQRRQNRQRLEGDAGMRPPADREATADDPLLRSACLRHQGAARHAALHRLAGVRDLKCRAATRPFGLLIIADSALCLARKGSLRYGQVTVRFAAESSTMTTRHVRQPAQAPALRIPTVGSFLARPSGHSGGRWMALTTARPWTTPSVDLALRDTASISRCRHPQKARVKEGCFTVPESTRMATPDIANPDDYGRAWFNSSRGRWRAGIAPARHALSAAERSTLEFDTIPRGRDRSHGCVYCADHILVLRR